MSSPQEASCIGIAIGAPASGQPILPCGKMGERMSLEDLGKLFPVAGPFGSGLEVSDSFLEEMLREIQPSLRAQLLPLLASRLPEQGHPCKEEPQKGRKGHVLSVFRRCGGTVSSMKAHYTASVDRLSHDFHSSSLVTRSSARHLSRLLGASATYRAPRPELFII